MVMYEQLDFGAVEGHVGGSFADADFDRLDGQGQLCAADIRAQLNGYRDDADVDLSELTNGATAAQPAEAHDHVCDGGDTCYPGGRPDGAQACRPLDEAAQRRLQRGYALASAVVGGEVDWRSLPVIG
jgi:hypothetical protein